MRGAKNEKTVYFERENANENTKFLLSNLPFDVFIHNLFAREIAV